MKEITFDDMKKLKLKEKEDFESPEKKKLQ